MRKLASIQRVLDIYPIKDADFIETAQINGWQCIVRKGEFKVGDLGVYFEIDSVPPNTPTFEFLWAPLVAPTPSFRIRTKKLRGVISQGLLLPLSAFTQMGPDIFVEGQNVTEQLGVTKYDLPVRLPGVRSGESPYGAFPADVPKTDEERLQSIGTKILDELRGEPYVITEKCDGTSATFSIDRDGVFRVYSRNWEIKEGENVYWTVARLHRIEDALRYCSAHFHNWALQGEIVGPGIQKNRLGLTRHELRVFNLFDKDTGKHLGRHSLDNFCFSWRIPQCLRVTSGNSFDYTQAQLLKMAEGKYEGTQNEREGIVVRHADNKHSRILGDRISFKVVSNRYLLKETDE